MSIRGDNIGPVSISNYLKYGQIEQVLCDGENYGGARPCHDEWGYEISESYKKIFGTKCQRCGMKPICNGCSNCGSADKLISINMNAIAGAYRPYGLCVFFVCLKVQRHCTFLSISSIFGKGSDLS